MGRLYLHLWEGRRRVFDEEFVEAEHPREADGKFAEKSAAPAKKAKTPPPVSWTKHGGGFFTEEEHARLRALKIPPAWTEIKLSADPESPLQVVGKDAKGRAQYRYSAKHAEAAAAAKFARLKAFNRVATKIVQSASTDMFNDALPKAEREAAAVIRLISVTGFRIGSDKDTKADTQAYGASTLTREHVKIGRGGAISFEFTGKKGVHISKEIKDHELARYIRQRIAAGDDRLFDVPAAQVRRYLKSKGGAEFKVKDFRTWHGTNEALKAMEGMDAPTNVSQFQRQRLEVARKVAAHLGNTPTVALAAYIDPAVFARWERAL